jgi:hypothetical protein
MCQKVDTLAVQSLMAFMTTALKMLQYAASDLEASTLWSGTAWKEMREP